jgi:hypothetical protein
MYRRKILRQSNPGAPDGLHLHTLVYRRVVSRLFAQNQKQPWKRNASVACLIVPWVAGSALISVIVGRTTVGGFLIVVGQLATYIVLYARIVRGRWGTRQEGALAEHKNIELNTR